MKRTFCIVFCILFATCLAITIIYFNIYPLKYKKQIISYAKQYNLDKSLVASVICAESKFNKDAKSKSGACGLMQIMPTTFSWICAELETPDANIFDAQTNIKYGCYYLRYLFDKYNDEIYVLCSYNAGETVAKTWAKNGKISYDDIKYAETLSYVKKVQKLKQVYDGRL